MLVISRKLKKVPARSKISSLRPSSGKSFFHGERKDQKCGAAQPACLWSRSCRWTCLLAEMPERETLREPSLRCFYFLGGLFWRLHDSDRCAEDLRQPPSIAHNQHGWEGTLSLPLVCFGYCRLSGHQIVRCWVMLLWRPPPPLNASLQLLIAVHPSAIPRMSTCSVTRR